MDAPWSSAVDDVKLATDLLRQLGAKATGAQIAEIVSRLDTATRALRTAVAAAPRTAPGVRRDAGNSDRSRDPADSTLAPFVAPSPRPSTKHDTRSKALPSIARTPAAQSPRNGKSPRRPSQSADLNTSGMSFLPAPPDASRLAPSRTPAASSFRPGHSDSHAQARQNEVEAIVSASVFNALEAVVNVLRAEGGALYVPVVDEMVAIASLSPQQTYPPPLLKHLTAGSVAGGVLSSGVAVHQMRHGFDDINRKIASQMLFPVTSRDGRHIAVLQVFNKYRGKAAFSEHDEAFASVVCGLFAELLTRYSGISLTASLFDPVALHKTQPFSPPVLAKNIYETLPPEMREFRLASMIHRSSGTVTLARRQTLADDAAALNNIPTLREIDCYINNLQDCWQRSVESNISHGHQEHHRIQQLRQMREELAAAKHQLKHLQDRMRLENLDVGDYRREYGTLKEELDRYLERKRAFDD